MTDAPRQPIARFLEVCLDTADPLSDIAAFWAAVSSGRAEQMAPEGPRDVIGREDHQGLAICPVPEPKTVKNRAHLDVYARSLDDLIALGATVVEPAEETGRHWSLMNDPEGNEFCAFLRDTLPDWRVHGLVVDSVDPERIARWWAEAYAAELSDEYGAGLCTVLGSTSDSVFTFDFNGVPEPKTVKNRVHWDVYGRPEDLLDHGATLLRELPDWSVLADPEGNEFCVFPEPEPG